MKLLENIKVIGLAGKAQSGKTYIANEIKKVLTSNNDYGLMEHEVAVMSIAEPVNEHAAKICVDEGDVRKAEHDLYFIYDKYCGFEERIYELAEAAKNSNVKVLIIDDVKTNADIDVLNSICSDVQYVRIERVNEYNSLLTKKQEKDSIECELDGYNYNYTYKNSGTRRNARTDHIALCELVENIFLQDNNQ